VTTDPPVAQGHPEQTSSETSTVPRLYVAVLDPQTNDVINEDDRSKPWTRARHSYFSAVFLLFIAVCVTIPGLVLIALSASYVSIAGYCLLMLGIILTIVGLAYVYWLYRSYRENERRAPREGDEIQFRPVRRDSEVDPRRR